MNITELPLSELHADTDFNCRGEILPIDVIDLARDMGERGLLNPITVRPYSALEQRETGKRYLIVAGYRRHKAALVLGWTTIPAIVREMSDVNARLMNLSENVHRKDLTILQEAKALQNLKLAGLTQDDVARYLNQSRGWVQVRYMLLDLPMEIQHEAAAGILTQQQIRDLYALGDRHKQYEAVKAIKNARLKGEKTPKVLPKRKSLRAKLRREKEEIFEMIDNIMSVVGPNFGTRCLAWAAGEISDLDLYRELKILANEQGVQYELPSEALSAV